VSDFDYIVIALYAGLVLGIGLWTARGHTAPSDLLLGRRSVPGWAVLFSMIATELSAATFIGVPVAAYSGNWSYLQLAFGALLGKLALAHWVIPLYHKLKVVTIYEFLATAFGPHTRRASAVAFVCGRVLASGVRLFIAALAFSLVSEQSIEVTIVACGVLSIAYTRIGGIRSVIWTDVLQGAVFVFAACALLWSVTSVEGGVTAVFDWGTANGKTKIFQWTPLFTMSTSLGFGTALIGGFFLTLATHATDYDMVQRLLTTRSGRAGGRALAGSGLLNFPLSLMFLFIGTGIAYHYSQHATAVGYDITASDQILPLFALHELSAGARGLVFAGLLAAAMSSLDSAICAIATTWVIDIAPRSDDSESESGLAARLRRTSTVTGVSLIAAALAMSSYHTSLRADASGPNLVEFALSSMSILYGGLLGVFARGLLQSRPGNDRAAVWGLIAGSLIGLSLFLHPIVLGQTLIAWTYWIPIAATCSFAITAAPSMGTRSTTG
jgi:SSS family solute:Na+ symporter